VELRLKTEGRFRCRFTPYTHTRTRIHTYRCMYTCTHINTHTYKHTHARTHHCATVSLFSREKGGRGGRESICFNKRQHLLLFVDRVLRCVAVCCSVGQNGVVCCSVLQCGAVWCSVLQCVAVCCSVLQCVAVCFSVLQYVAHIATKKEQMQKNYSVVSACVHVYIYIYIQI